jgi:hypothetical protein
MKPAWLGDLIEAKQRPVVGMGLTARIYTDCDALTIVRVSPSGKTFWATRDVATLKPDWKPDWVPGGFAGHVLNNYEQEYDYKTNPDGEQLAFRLTKNGWTNRRYSRVTLGLRRAFHDYNF